MGELSNHKNQGEKEPGPTMEQIMQHPLKDLHLCPKCHIELNLSNGLMACPQCVFCRK